MPRKEQLRVAIRLEVVPLHVVYRVARLHCNDADADVHILVLLSAPVCLLSDFHRWRVLVNQRLQACLCTLTIVGIGKVEQHSPLEWKIVR